jgi:hypothetical protein
LLSSSARAQVRPTRRDLVVGARVRARGAPTRRRARESPCAATLAAVAVVAANDARR